MKNNIPQGYKATALGIIPQEWEAMRLSDVCTLINGRAYKQNELLSKGKYKILRVGNFFTNDSWYFSDMELAPNKYAYKGDLLYAWSASFGPRFWTGDKVIYHYHIWKICNLRGINQQYLYFFLDYDASLLQRDTQGGTMHHITKENMEKRFIPVPPLAEQRKIAEVLGVWDEAIEKQARLIEKLALRKRALMQRLLSAKLRLPGFSEKWEEVELGEVLSYEQPTPYIVRDTNYQNNYKTPVLTAGKTFILGYTNEGNGICKNIPVILFDDFTTDSRYIDFEFKVKSSATKLLRVKGQNNLYFIFCALQCFKYPIGGHERHWISKFQYLTIALPSIEEQTAIAEVLTAADREIELAKEKLERLRRQKRGLMQQLLTGKKRVKY